MERDLLAALAAMVAYSTTLEGRVRALEGANRSLSEDLEKALALLRERPAEAPAAETSTPPAEASPRPGRPRGIPRGAYLAEGP